MTRDGRVRSLGLLWLLAVGVGPTVVDLRPTPARAEFTLHDLSPCRGRDVGIEHLRCDDRIDRPQPAAFGDEAVKSAYAPMSVTDLLLDADTLAGKRVTVTGVLQQLGDVVMLRRELVDANVIFIDVKRVPREERRRILEQCARGCTATVSGKVERVMMQPGLMAERVLVP